METWIRKDVQYAGRVVTVQAGEVRLDDGATAFREVVEHNGAVGVAPFIEGRVIFVEQFRTAIGQTMLEIPAGKLEGGEAPESRGRAELEEETGYRAGRLVPAGRMYPSCGILTECIHLYLAFDLEKTVQRLEDDERITIVEHPIETVRAMLGRHEFEDAKTIAGLHALLAHLAA